MNSLKAKLQSTFDKLPFKLPIYAWVAIAMAMILLIGAGIYSAVTGKTSVQDIADTVIPTQTHDYNESEQLLYNNVKTYLTDMLDNREKENAKVAEDAVENFDIIISSGAPQITQDHTNAIKKNMRQSILENITGASESLTSDDLEYLSSDCASLILEMIMEQMEEYSTEDAKATRAYLTLHDSLQKQIEYLADAQMKVTISASIRDNYIDKKQLLNVLGSLSDEEQYTYLSQLASILGMSYNELVEKLKSDGIDSFNIDDETLSWLQGLTSSDIAKIESGSKGEKGDTGATGAQGAKGEKGDTGARGATGATGATGARGAAGATGAAGKDGSDGEDAYVHIKYATANPTQDSSATVTDAPTSDTKFMGVYNSNSAQSPNNWYLYTWTQYKDLSITAVVDEDGVTNIVIH